MFAPADKWTKNSIRSYRAVKAVYISSTDYLFAVFVFSASYAYLYICDSDIKASELVGSHCVKWGMETRKLPGMSLCVGEGVSPLYNLDDDMSWMILWGKPAEIGINQGKCRDGRIR